MRTTISCSEALADELYSRKRRGESYEAVIWRLIEQAEGEDQRPTSDEHTRTHARDEWTPEAVADAVEKSMTDAQRRSLVAGLEHLRDQGTTVTGEIVAAAMDAEPTSYKDEESWRKNLWNHIGDDLKATGAVELVVKHEGRWQWTG